MRARVDFQQNRQYPLIRAQICDGLGFLGIELSRKRNAKNPPGMSPDAGRVEVRVVRIDDVLMIAKAVTRVLPLGSIQEA